MLKLINMDMINVDEVLKFRNWLFSVTTKEERNKLIKEMWENSSRWQKLVRVYKEYKEITN